MAKAAPKKVKKAVVKKPAPKKPAPKKQVAKKPVAKKPVAKKLVTKKSVEKKAIAKKTPVKKLADRKLPAKKPAASAPSKPLPTKKAAVKPMTKTASPAPAPVKKTQNLKPYKPAKLPKDYKPSTKEEYMNPLQQEYFRQKLLAWRAELLNESRETLDHLHEENWHQADIADRASLETEAGIELRTRNRYLKLISKIDSAIRRIENGEYGYCEESGEPIGLKRLEARPVATLSIEAQERHEKIERQFTDEE